MGPVRIDTYSAEFVQRVYYIAAINAHGLDHGSE